MTKSENIETFIVKLIRLIANYPKHIDTVIESVNATSTEDCKHLEKDNEAPHRKRMG